MESIVESSAGSFEYDQVLGVMETMVSYIYCLLLFLFQFLHAVVLFYLLHKKTAYISVIALPVTILSKL